MVKIVGSLEQEIMAERNKVIEHCMQCPSHEILRCTEWMDKIYKIQGNLHCDQLIAKLNTKL